jgi:ubiquinone biosynthesis protein
MLDSKRVQRLIAAVPAGQMEAVMSAFSDAGSTEARVEAVAAVLRTAGQQWRDQVGEWIADLLSVETLVPETFSHWRPLVHDAMSFVASHISDARLAPKIVEQIELPPDTGPEIRLGLVIAKTPGLQKLGQVLARARRLSPSLRSELQKLENGISDVTASEVRLIANQQLARCVDAYKVRLSTRLLSEASVSAILEFTWLNPSKGVREDGVFKVMKPHVPSCYDEDLRLLQDLAAHLAASNYYVQSREVVDTLEEVRLLLQREVDFRREQATLAEVNRVYTRRATRAPRVIPELCTDTITAMTVERGVKVTEAFRHNPAGRRRVAAQIIESLLADPIFSDEENAVFHADPHAGNLLYDEKTGDLIVLDWALTGRLSLEERRQVARLMLAMSFRDVPNVRSSIHALSLGDREGGGRRRTAETIDRCVDEFFAAAPLVWSPGPIDAMHLLDEIGVEGVRFPASLVFIRKVLFTLDGVLHDVAEGTVRMDTVIAGDFMARLWKRRGKLPPPFRIADYLMAQCSAVRYATGLWAFRS